MKLDKKALDRLLSMNDAQLKSVIESIAQESGLDLSSIGINDTSIASIRNALSGADDTTIKKAAEQLEEWNRGKRKGR